VTINPDGDQVEGYHIHVGGGFADKGRIGRMLYPDVKAEDAPTKIEALLRAYLAHRSGPAEDFYAFANRHDDDELRRLAAEAAP